MDITGIHEDHSMMGGKVLFELELEAHEVNVINVDYLGYAFTEPYDGTHLWFWSQVDLNTTLQDTAFWHSVSEGISGANNGNAPTAEELVQMVTARIANGNEPGFEARLS